jgi:peptidyl-prolyl cis-trans isomerase SurA
MRSFLKVFLCASLCLSSARAAEPLEIDRIVAVVNNAVVTAFDLNHRVRQAERQIAAQRIALPPRRVLEQQMLERMITERALLQYAADSGIRISAQQLDRSLARIAADNNMDLPAFRTALAKEGEHWSAFREQVRTEMTLSRMREREVDAKVSVSDAEIDLYLQNQGKANEPQEEYAINHILVAVPEAASPEVIAERRAKAEKALTELQAGRAFLAVSAAYSDAPNAIDGGSLGWRKAGQLPTLFLDAIKPLQKGAITPLLRSGNGFHLLQLADRRSQAFILEQTHARHILIKTNEIVTDAEATRRLNDLRGRILNGAADFGELAKLHSDDLSASKGGDLGWLNPDDTVPEFERAMNALKPGEVSEAIASPFGWHLISVIERRNQDLTQERRRIDARRAIRARKGEEAFDDFVRQIRDSAYVELRGE